MWKSRSKSAAGVLAAIVLCVGGAAVSSSRARAEDFSRIDKRIAEIQPSAKEKRFEEIGWAKGIPEAERLARESDRPVFLFSNVGHMDLGRC